MNLYAVVHSWYLFILFKVTYTYIHKLSFLFRK